MQMTMMMPKSMISKGSIYTSDETAAIILHEVGHAFTFMEFVSRMMTTNQAIAGLSRFLDGSVTQEKRIVLFARAADELHLDSQKKEALKKCKYPEQISVILLDQAISKSISELGSNIYDFTTCEYLADQFAARQGASSALVSALDKLFVSFGPDYTKVNIGTTIILVYVALASIAVPIIGIIFIAILLTAQLPVDSYDKPETRFLRLKQQVIEQLKNDDIDNEKRSALIEDIDKIDNLIKNMDYKRNPLWLGRILEFVKPGYRPTDKYEKLQSELEKFANNDSFVHAAKLKMV